MSGQITTSNRSPRSRYDFGRVPKVQKKSGKEILMGILPITFCLTSNVCIYRFTSETEYRNQSVHEKENFSFHTEGSTSTTSTTPTTLLTLHSSKYVMEQEKGDWTEGLCW